MRVFNASARDAPKRRWKPPGTIPGAALSRIEHSPRMKNWKKIAQSSDIKIPETEIERLAPSLDALEAAFRPLVNTIPDDIEPAVTFRIEPEAGE